MGARALWLSGASGQVIVDNDISMDCVYHDDCDDDDDDSSDDDDGNGFDNDIDEHLEGEAGVDLLEFALARILDVELDRLPS